MTRNEPVEDCPSSVSKLFARAIIQATKHPRVNNRGIWCGDPMAIRARKSLEVRNCEFSAGLEFAVARSAQWLVARHAKSLSPVTLRLREVP
jgi:hypothetical protein